MFHLLFFSVHWSTVWNRKSCIHWSHIAEASMNMDDIKVLEPTLKVHTFKDKIMEHEVFFQVIKLQDSFYIWLGKSSQFGDLSVAMVTLGKLTSSTNLIGGNESHSVTLAERLSKKTGKQIFVGGDLMSFDQLQLPLLEKRITEEMKRNPAMF